MYKNDRWFSNLINKPYVKLTKRLALIPRFNE